MEINKKNLILELGKNNKLTTELATFIRTRSDADISARILQEKPNRAMLIAIGYPIIRKPSKKQATEKEINRYLELHCSSIGMEYTGFEYTTKDNGMWAKLDKDWEISLSSLPIADVWYTLGLPNRIAKACGAAQLDDKYEPLAALFERNIWVYGPDRETFTWYVYNSIGEEITYPMVG